MTKPSKCVYLPSEINAFWLKTQLQNFGTENRIALTSVKVSFESDSRDGTQAMFLRVF